MIIIKRVDNTVKAKKEVCPNGFEKINVLSWKPKETKFYELSPYHLKTDGKGEIDMPAGIIFENAWQSSKVYETVYDIEVYPSFFQKNKPEYLQWKYVCSNGTGRETHWNHLNDSITPEYYGWRNSIWNCPHPIRYPNRRQNSKYTKFGMVKLKNQNEIRFGYIEGRKNFYFSEYIRLIHSIESYYNILNMLKEGKNILILEIDVPSPNKKGYYGKMCDSFGYYRATKETLLQLLDDPSEAFGHGLCLAFSLLNDL